ncbi:hypothetical protein AVEN_182992-1 [Araneus ventricosus]|uniref:Uncharacterized protein n=1 Tax=Araneus ventricosus TaxID=182803 RepID=A0A4Y2G3W5_ARAVE|nr:hypothetical protein AVEN_182992-1 [Araneus ventricosus]
MDFVILNRLRRRGRHMSWYPSLQDSAPHQREGMRPPPYDLTRNRPNTRRIFNGIGFRTWKPSGCEADNLQDHHGLAVKCRVSVPISKEV